MEFNKIEEKCLVHRHATKHGYRCVMFTFPYTLKSSVIFEALGDLDELSSHIGLLCTRVGEQRFLRLIQVKLIDISSNLATLDEQKRKRVRKITEEDVKEIEGKIDEYEEKNGKLTEFLLPGSTIADLQCHVCRSVSRRAERSVWNIIIIL